MTMPMRLGLVQRGDLRSEIAHMAVGAGILEDRAEDRRSGSSLSGVADDTTSIPSGLRRGFSSPRCSAGGSRRRRKMPWLSTWPPAAPWSWPRRQAVDSSRSEALAISSPVRSLTMVWKFSKRFQPPLADLGLIGGIGGVPGGVFQDVALDRRGGDSAVITLPDQRVRAPCSCSATLTHVMQQFAFGFGLAKIERRPIGGSLRGRSGRSVCPASGTPSTLNISSISAGDGPIWRRLAKS